MLSHLLVTLPSPDQSEINNFGLFVNYSDLVSHCTGVNQKKSTQTKTSAVCHLGNCKAKNIEIP